MVVSAYQEEAIKNLIWHLKYSSVKSIAEILAAIMTDFLTRERIRDYFASSLVTTVPLHCKRQRERGYNQADLIAAEFAKRVEFEYAPILERVKNTRDQVDLEKEERLENMAGAFSAMAMPSLGERKIILIDDVATTGATLNECARTLKKQNVVEIWGLVVARN